MAGTPSCKAEEVPDGAVPEVAKVLRAASWYEVLEVAASASTEEIKRAHKLKSLGTHPDKVGAANSGSHEASIRVNMVRAFFRASVCPAGSCRRAFHCAKTVLSNQRCAVMTFKAGLTQWTCM